jgi:hypothetical protein
MILNNPNTVVVEAIPAKEFPHLWLYNILVHSPSISTGRISVQTLPYNATTQEIGNGSHIVDIQTDQLWEAINEVPEVAQAMTSIFNAIEPLRGWIESKSIQNIPALELETPL